MRNGSEGKSPALELHFLTPKLVDISLRLLVIPLCVASLWVMVDNRQDNPDYGKLDFRSFTGLTYLVCINAISAGYTLLASLFSWLEGLTRLWVLFMSDQVMAYMMVTSGAVVAEILYLAYNGDKSVTWSEACDSYGMFCRKAKVSLVLHFLALLCLVVISVISAYRLFSMFGPPSLSKPGEREGEREGEGEGEEVG
ncbi:CASP-like protein 2D1 [Amborella trichopoda]|uniref:CASP-like protein 2D1 n=1 Tax=Amborella trichopoda TaxID=13333 RepID=UPI0005D3322A|nr:CASP-like protein 2D1 [Amborella trichopoda]|eukprot:XP_011627601.1 CASP-like protein 2D1 [Amborella trichopoda]